MKLFVAYCVPNPGGSLTINTCEVNCPQPINSFDDVKAIQTAVAQATGVEKAVVISWQRYDYDQH